MGVYFNDNDPYSAAWLRNLMADGLLPEGVVDARSIRDVHPADLAGYTQAHFFAGIGGWPYALALAGWPANEPVWTGSCPCQPYSTAGKGQGDDDPRNLWPEFRRLIAECRPAIVFGEQVDGKDGLRWLAGVHTDLEALDYAVGSVALPAACVGAPHERHRLFWVAESTGERYDGRQGPAGQRGREGAENDCPACPECGGPCGCNDNAFWCDACQRLWPRGIGWERSGLADAAGARRDDEGEYGSGPSSSPARPQQHGTTSGLGHAGPTGRARPSVQLQPGQPRPTDAEPARAGGDSGLGHAQGYDERRAPDRAHRTGSAVGGPSGDSRLAYPERAQRRTDRAQDGAGQGGDTPPSGGRVPAGGMGDSTRARAATAQQRGWIRGPEPAGFWDAYDLIPCLDGKARRVEPGLFPLVDGVPFRLADGRTREGVPRAQVLKGIGNAINPYAAAEFIAAYLESVRA